MSDEKRIEVNGTPGVARDPYHCPIEEQIKKQLPWAKRISVGERTIRAYDYRCEHNPDGVYGSCPRCPSRRVEWATPLPAAQSIRDLDRNGKAVYTVVTLREDEARVIPDTQDKVRKRQAMADYRAAIADGEHKPNKRSAKAKARAMRLRRRT